MNKSVILTGLRANNDLHIGNYFGALLPLIEMAKTNADTFDVHLFVPDLHSFTTPIDHSKLQEQIKHTIRLYAAAGLPLNNKSIHIYRQSYIPAHCELAWILECFTSFGEMRRMTQFKDKAKQLTGQQKSQTDGKLQPASVDDNYNITTLGLFNYPVLMAADILLYGAEYVPVGDDQTQHLEFARDIAARINSRFGPVFTIPKPVNEQHKFFGKEQGLRIKNLINPTIKMSKTTDSDKGVIFLGDSPKIAYAKIKSATTDSERTIGANPNPIDRPGITNLIQIYKLLRPNDTSDFSGESYGEFKDRVGNAVMEFLEDFQQKLSQVDDSQLFEKLKADEKAMNEVANATLYKIQEAIGLRPHA